MINYRKGILKVDIKRGVRKIYEKGQEVTVWQDVTSEFTKGIIGYMVANADYGDIFVSKHEIELQTK